MTDTRTRGFKSRVELEEQLAEIHDQTAKVHFSEDQKVDLQDLEREAAWLRKEISDLRSQLHVALGGDQADKAVQPAVRSYWRWAAGFAFAAAVLYWRMQVGQRRGM